MRIKSSIGFFRQPILCRSLTTCVNSGNSLTNEELLLKGLESYRNSLDYQFWLENVEDAINLGFGLLCQTRWYNKYEAEEAFDEAENLLGDLSDTEANEFREIIQCGRDMIHDTTSPYQKTGTGCFHFFQNGKHYTFEDKELGLGETKDSLSIVSIKT